MLLAGYGDLVRGTGIDHTPGALLAVCSTVLLLGAALVLALAPSAPSSVVIALAAAAGLDLLGTAAAAWFLHAWALLWTMAVGALGWIGWIAAKAADVGPSATREEHAS